MKNLEFKELNKGDYNFFKDIIRVSDDWQQEECSENELENYLLSYQMFNGQWRIWYKNNNKIGISYHIEWSPSNERPWIGTILIHPNQRLRGFGQNIIKEIGHELKSKGHKACYVGCSINQDGWLRFLGNCGFEQLKIEKEVTTSKEYMISVMPL
ncbi:GNAT family N-acetyltransferase [Metabacillus litoralis]|uniref:GNAT family N-acetyltransferase n=1 Tax=Metabacillus litoralis TaxID=152268 RepID=A0A5C6W5E3_9BACI|nr:GNAT family N-acetyltransferase [Metabacillus litoralis]TXC92102.1 GNAT family N-acetyltransferase [Metabacillus litoralis]